MPDQIVDKRSVGIPPDILDVREQTRGYRDSAQASALSAQGFSTSSAASAEAADASESAAAEYARQAAEWSVINNQGLRFGPTEPPVKIDGMLWIVTDEEQQAITSFARWDANAAGQGLFPAEDVYPSDTTYPSEQGAWKQFKVAATAVA